MRAFILAAIGSIGLCAAVQTAHAGSLVSHTLALRSTSDVNAADTVAYRRCWWRNGTRYCRRYGAGYYRYYGAYRYRYSGPSVGIILGIQ